MNSKVLISTLVSKFLPSCSLESQDEKINKKLLFLYSKKQNFPKTSRQYYENYSFPVIRALILNYLREYSGIKNDIY